MYLVERLAWYRVLGFRILSLGFRIEVLGLRMKGLGSRVEASMRARVWAGK